jgi:cold shock protein
VEQRYLRRSNLDQERYMATGTVKWFSQAKGFGFIQPEDGGADLFIHFSNISGSGFRNLEEGQKVEYEPQEGRKGMEATNVTVLG